jgi:hypothetical protein
MATPNDLDAQKREAKKAEKAERKAARAERKRIAESERGLERRKRVVDDEDDDADRTVVVQEREPIELEERRPTNPLGAIFGIFGGGN